MVTANGSGQITNLVTLSPSNAVEAKGNVVVPSVDLKGSNSDGPLFINTGDSVNLTWSSINTTSCYGTWTSPANSSVALNNSTGTSVGPFNSIGTYTETITCYKGINASATDSVSITVSNANNTLTLCADSCSSTKLRGNVAGTVTTPFAVGATENWVSCYNASTTCSSATNNQGGGWTTSDSGIVSLGGNGFPRTINGVSAGTATVTDIVTGEGTASGTVTVTAPTSTLKVCPKTPTATVNQYLQMHAYYDTATDCGTATTDVTASTTWTSGTSSVLSVDAAKGKCHALAAGTSTLKAVYNPGPAPVSDQTDATVTASSCVPATACTPAQQQTICKGNTGSIPDGCTGTLTCTGTRDCSWVEVAP